MRVIVSTVLEDNLEGYKVVKEFAAAVKIEPLECLIVHRDIKNGFDACLHVTNIRAGEGTKFFYICKPEYQDSEVRSLITGLGGIVADDEFYYEDADELSEFINYSLSDDESTELAVLGSEFNTIQEFIHAYEVKDERINAPIYLEQVKTALTNLEERTKQQRYELVQMGSSVVDILQKASKIIVAISDKSTELERHLNDMEKQMSSNTGRGGLIPNEMVYYPAYHHSGNSKVLVINEVSPCRYLTSFVLAYARYVKLERNKRVRVVIAHRKGRGLSLKYEDCGFAKITKESVQNKELFKNELIATDIPNNDVLKPLLDLEDGLVIVINRMYTGNDLITAKAIRLNAVSGMSDLTKFKLKPETCIFTISAPKNAFIMIPHINAYPDKEVTRHSCYKKNCGELYTKLDAYLKI